MKVQPAPRRLDVLAGTEPSAGEIRARAERHVVRREGRDEDEVSGAVDRISDLELEERLGRPDPNVERLVDRPLAPLIDRRTTTARVERRTGGTPALRWHVGGRPGPSH